MPNSIMFSDRHQLMSHSRHYSSRFQITGRHFLRIRFEEGGTALPLWMKDWSMWHKRVLLRRSPLESLLTSSGGVSEQARFSRQYKFLKISLAISWNKRSWRRYGAAVYSSNSQGGQSHLHDCASRQLTEESPVGVTVPRTGSGRCCGQTYLALSRCNVPLYRVGAVSSLVGKHARCCARPVRRAQRCGVQRIFKQTTSSDDANAFKSGKNDEIPGRKALLPVGQDIL
jgi:hypothetical protein